MSRSASYALLAERNFGWFFGSQLVNLAGSMMAPLALAFAVLDLSDSASALGVVLAARSIPTVLFVLLGGVLADRIDRRSVIQWSNVLSGLTQGVVAWLIISGHAELWQIAALEAVNGTVSAASLPAEEGLVPQLVARAQLQQANVLLSMSRGAVLVIGPSIAALLVTTVGPGWALAADAATWLVAAVLLLPVRIPPRPARTEASGIFREMHEGWQLFRGTTWLWVVVVAFGLLNAISSGALSTLGPAVAKHTFGPGGYGVAQSARAVGVLLITVVLLRLPLRRPLLWGMLGMLPAVLPMLVLGIDPAVAPLVVGMFVAGAGTQVFVLGWSLAMAENIPEEMLSRAYSYDMLGSFVAIPIGELVYGPLGDWLGYRDVLVASAAAYAVIVLLTLTSRSVRRMGRVTAEVSTT